MANMRDAARQMAAAGLTGGNAGEMPTPDMPVGEDVESAPAGGDLESALAMVEAAIANLPSDLARKARMHIEGLREIAASGEAATEPPEMSEASTVPVQKVPAEEA